MDVMASKTSGYSKDIYQLLQIGNPKIHTASERISYRFLKLLEQQFPVTDQRNTVEFRYPSQFAEQLNVHVNHLNRSLKETVNRTTTEIISIRVLYEAKRLLDQTDWNITDIAYSLGFSEVTQFNNFFKKSTRVSPTEYRKLYLRRTLHH